MTDRTDAVFSALGDATRREVMRCLAEEGAVTATGIAARLPISRQAVAKHLSALSGAGLVEAERAGRETRYRLTPEPMGDAMAWMASLGAEWDERLARLRDYLTKTAAATPAGSGRPRPRP